MAHIEITARDLKELVEPVLGMVGHGDLPRLDGVNFAIRGAFLTAYATDRFRVGMMRTSAHEASGKVDDFFMSASALRQILRIYKPTRWDNPSLRFSVKKDRTVEIHQSGAIEEIWTSSLTFVAAAGGDEPMPDLFEILRKNLNKCLNEKAPRLGAVGLNPKYLASFAKASRGGDPLVIRVAAKAEEPCIVTCGDYFIGAIMPVRLADEKPDWSDILGALEKVA